MGLFQVWIKENFYVWSFVNLWRQDEQPDQEWF